MTLLIEPEIGVPLADDIPNVDLKERAEAACNTALKLAEHGLDLEPTVEDEDAAAKLALAYADNPEKTSKKVTAKKAATLTPASIVLTNNILQEFGHSVAESATQIRYLVTNKLLLESENADPRIRIRALELLGKISDVGLFAEKSEVTVTHQSTEDLRNKLRGKLEKLVQPVEIEEVDYEDVVLDGEALNLEEELGVDEIADAVNEVADDSIHS
jgi:hypothetical protein|tara:strand:- start:1315 stop:1959 length:645 start_codon:yes stop_codon:yes gene_type:complete